MRAGVPMPPIDWKGERMTGEQLDFAVCPRCYSPLSSVEVWNDQGPVTYKGYVWACGTCGWNEDMPYDWNDSEEDVPPTDRRENST